MGWFFPPAQPASQPPPAHLPPGTVVVTRAPPPTVSLATRLATVQASWAREAWPAQTQADSGGVTAKAVLNAPFPNPFWDYKSQANIRSSWPVEQWSSQELIGGGVGGAVATVVPPFPPVTPDVQIATIIASWPREQWPAQTAGISSAQIQSQVYPFTPSPPIANFWTMRLSWPPENWYAQSEPAIASGIAQIQLPPPYQPTSVVGKVSLLRGLWPQEMWSAQTAVQGAGAQLPPVIPLPTPIPHSEFRLWPQEGWSAQPGTRGASAFALTAPAVPYVAINQQSAIRMSWPQEAWPAQHGATILGVLPTRVSAFASSRISRSIAWMWPQEVWLAQSGVRTGGALAPVFVRVPSPPQRYDIQKIMVSWPQEQWSTRLAGTSAGALAKPAIPPLPPPIIIVPLTNWGGRVALSPKKLGEDINQPMDFISRLAVGETIVAASVTCSAYSGGDPNAQNMINGPASVSNTVVVQTIVGGVLGVIYELLFTVNTSAGQILQLSGYFAIVPDLT